MQITGTISGDGFPSAESFVTDKNGNSVFLGIFATPSNRTPQLSLWGSGREKMIDIDIKIAVDKDGVFLGVLNGQTGPNGEKITINIKDWNKQFETKSTRGSGTNINSETDIWNLSQHFF